MSERGFPADRMSAIPLTAPQERRTCDDGLRVGRPRPRDGPRRHAIPASGEYGRGGLRDRARRTPHRPAERRAGEHQAHPLRDRRRDQLPGQLLGLSRRSQRDPYGEGAAGRLPRPGLLDDEDRRPHARVGRSTDRRVPRPAADRRDRPAPVPRGDPARGPGQDLRRGGSDGGGAGAAPGR